VSCPGSGSTKLIEFGNKTSTLVWITISMTCSKFFRKEDEKGEDFGSGIQSSQQSPGLFHLIGQLEDIVDKVISG
jgi:hypothetical protein